MVRIVVSAMMSLSLATLAACGGDSTTSCQGDCDAGGLPSTSPQVSSGASSLLGTNPTSYSETQEVSNSSASMAESTGYTLEGTEGLAIRGAFESSGASSDAYRFSSGTFGTASTPGFPGVDIQLVIDGQPMRDSGHLIMFLDTVVKTGYSSLSGGYFTNAALIQGKEYVLTLSPVAPGKSYTLEIRGHKP